MLRVLGREDVARLLDYRGCIGVVRDAMADLSAGRTRQMLRQVMPLDGDEDVLSVMAGVMPARIGFGAKIISVVPGNAKLGMQAHSGVAVLFDAADGQPLCILHAGELTRIRTAAASAVATAALARDDASHLAVLGYGEQGQAHVESMAMVRKLKSVRLWGRSPDEARRVADHLSERIELPVEPAGSVEEAVEMADIICTTTGAVDPILLDPWVAPGTHINLVGSSVASFAEIDSALLRRSRFFADHRDGVLKQGGEYLRALAEGVVDERHVLGEIGDALNGAVPGRTSPDDVTIYKSLGHIVQDIASARLAFDRAEAGGDGSLAAF